MDQRECVIGVQVAEPNDNKEGSVIIGDYSINKFKNSENKCSLIIWKHKGKRSFESMEISIKEWNEFMKRLFEEKF